MSKRGDCRQPCSCRARTPQELVDALARFYGIPADHAATLLAGFRSYGWELVRTADLDELRKRPTHDEVAGVIRAAAGGAS